MTTDELRERRQLMESLNQEADAFLARLREIHAALASIQKQWQDLPTDDSLKELAQSAACLVGSLESAVESFDSLPPEA